MTDSLKLAEMQRTSIEFERQRHLANWFIKSSPHMATPPQTTTTATGTTATTTALSGGGGITPNGTGHSNNATSNNTSSATTLTAQQHQQSNTKHNNSSNNCGGGSGHNSNVFYLMSSNGNTGAVGGGGGNSSGHTNGKHSNGGASPVITATPSSSAAAAAAAAMCTVPGAGGAGALGHLHVVEGRKPKLRRFNSHDTSSNMFSVADFENARLARRNEIEMKQRLQRRMRMSANGGYAGGCGGDRVSGNSNGHSSSGGGGGGGNGGGVYGSGGSMGGDYSTGDSKASKYSNDSQHEPLAADIFLDRYSLPRVVRISYKTKFSDETLQSSSSNGSSTVTSTSNSSSAASGTVGISSAGGNSSGGGGAGGSGTATSSSTASSNVNVHHHQHHTNTTGSGSGSTKNVINTNNMNVGSAATATQQSTINSSNVDVLEHQEHGELFLLYRLIRQRHIYHGYNAKTAATNRKKGVLIPQEFPGYFSLLNEKGLPTATLYTSLIQLVRERVFKFVSVDNMPAFTESQPNVSNPPPTSEGCMPSMYTAPPPPTTNSRPQYVKTTARSGQVFRLLAVFEDGKQDHNAIGSSGTSGSMNAKPNSSHGREKEKGRYAQLLNENRQVLYVSLSTKGKFYEIEPGIPQILQKLGGMSNDANKKVNPDCVHRITAMVTPNKELPLTLRYISGPSGCANAIPESVCITRITTENVMMACPIEDQVEVQSPLHLRKLHLTKEMNLLKSFLGFESEQRMFANPNVQNILKFCQFNCDQFLKMVEVEILHRPERSGSKSRVDGLKILKPLHLPKLLRREKTTISAHEKEDSIIFLSKSDLASLEAKEAAAVVANATIESSGGSGVPVAASSSGNRISEKMKVFQSTKKKWFRKQDKHAVVNSSLTAFDLDVQAKRMSMERYSDMSKLLQERFGDKTNSLSTSQEHESISERSGTSDIGGCSDTETTTLATIEEKLRKFSHSHHKCTTSTEPMLQKSMSLQDIELIGGGGGGNMNGSGRKPDLLAHGDTISEAGTDLEDLENQTPIPQSFITEKLYNEFHVKTRQYSKSSSSLHQLINFSLPQKLQTHHDTKRTLSQIKHNGAGSGAVGVSSSSKFDRRLEFNIGEPVTGRRAAGGLCLLAAGSSSVNSCGNSQNTSLISPLTPTSLIEDDLPYSSVRDSLVLSSDESGASDNAAGNICQALNLIDYAKENIYAEICHDASAMGGGGGCGGGGGSIAGGGIPNSQTRDTFSSETHSTQISDDYGDYASLTYPTYTAQNQQQQLAINNGNGNGFSSTSSNSNSSTTGNAISRVQINCSSSPVSYHTVYLGDEPLGEHHYPTAAAASAAAAAERRRIARDDGSNHPQQQHHHHHHMRSDRSHVTTVELEGNNGSGGSATGAALRAAASSDLEAVDNIYNTLK